MSTVPAIRHSELLAEEGRLAPHCLSDADAPHNLEGAHPGSMKQQEPALMEGTREAEPEIIPPGADPAGRSRSSVSSAPHYTMRIRMTRLGPVGIVMLLLMIGILGLAGLTLLLGFALIGLTVAGVLMVVSIIFGLLRRLSR